MAKHNYKDLLYVDWSDETSRGPVLVLCFFIGYEEDTHEEYSLVAIHRSTNAHDIRFTYWRHIEINCALSPELIGQAQNLFSEENWRIAYIPTKSLTSNTSPYTEEELIERLKIEVDEKGWI